MVPSLCITKAFKSMMGVADSPSSRLRFRTVFWRLGLGQAGMYPDGRCYGNAMRACAAAGNWQLALALLNTMRKEGVTRMAFHYNIAMQVRRGGRTTTRVLDGWGSCGHG